MEDTNNFLSLIGGGCSNTLTSVQKDNYVYEKNLEPQIIKKFNTEENMAKTEKPEGKGWVWDDEEEVWFRIRKLTPRECFRLMGVSEDVIDKIQNAKFKKGSLIPSEDGTATISKSQQYKMAGNSIVVDCLEGIFRNLYIEKPTPTTLF